MTFLQLFSQSDISYGIFREPDLSKRRFVVRIFVLGLKNPFEWQFHFCRDSIAYVTLISYNFFCGRRNELVNIDERRQQAAMKEFYEDEALKEHNRNRIQSLKTFSKVINPILCLGFVFAFWAVGLHHAYKI